MMKEINWQKGLSLVGLMVAVSIIATTAMVLTRLVVETERLSSVSRGKFVAANLAREGLELVRVVRDTNVLDVNSERAWIEDLCGDIRLSAFSVDDWLRGNSNTPLINDGNVFGVYDRSINVDCTNQDIDPRHITVTATVTWEHQGNTRTVIVTERLYDWL